MPHHKRIHTDCKRAYTARSGDGKICCMTRQGTVVFKARPDCFGGHIESSFVNYLFTSIIIYTSTSKLSHKSLIRRLLLLIKIYVQTWHRNRLTNELLKILFQSIQSLQNNIIHTFFQYSCASEHWQYFNSLEKKRKLRKSNHNTLLSHSPSINDSHQKTHAFT